MDRRMGLLGWLLALLALGLAGCQTGAGTETLNQTAPVQDQRVLATATYLADIAQNVAGERLEVSALLPSGADPHSFSPTPSDVRRVANSDVLIINGAGFEGYLADLLENAGGDQVVIDASAGLQPRQPDGGEVGDEHEAEGDPHFWLDPTNVIRYVENIRDGLSEYDPEGADAYSANAEAYISELKALDSWIAEQVAQVPPANRELVTNHESFGYFADRYGFEITGAIIPSFSSGASPSAQQLAQLADQIRGSGVKAIFLETGANPQLAAQLAQETGVRVISGLHTHSVGQGPDDPRSYIDMMRDNTSMIVDALK